MLSWLNDMSRLLSSQGYLVFPLLLALWIAWGDLKTHRIPNYLTFTAALAGLIYGLIFHGWIGLGEGLLGMFLGFGLLLAPYLMGGMGAGDVKALAALGAWLGPGLTFYLFLYMGIAGGIIALGVLGWKGLLWSKIREGWVLLVNLILSRPCGLGPNDIPSPQIEGIPYGVAMALGMVVLVGTMGPKG